MIPGVPSTCIVETLFFFGFPTYCSTVLSIFIFYSEYASTILARIDVQFLATRYKQRRRMQFFFFLLSILVGSRMIYIINHASWLTNLKQVSLRRVDNCVLVPTFDVVPSTCHNLDLYHCPARSRTGSGSSCYDCRFCVVERPQAFFLMF